MFRDLSDERGASWFATLRLRSSNVLLPVLVLLVLSVPKTSWAQACCAGAGAVTPGRLTIHEDALVGLQVRAAHVFGSFDTRGRYVPSSHGVDEQSFEQDVIAAVRLPLAPRLQLAALLPFVETRRAAGGTSDFGGGLGDVNLSARYDFFQAGRARYVPGIALLAGFTFPTGTPPESASPPLAVDATGTGAFQGNVGLAVEQTFGPWLVTAYGLVAKRAPRTIHGTTSSLGVQWTALVAVARTLPGDFAVAVSASYAVEGEAELDGVPVPGSSRRIPSVGLFGVVPFSDRFRLQGGPSVTPMFDHLGKNQVATIALAVTALYAWY